MCISFQQKLTTAENSILLHTQVLYFHAIILNIRNKALYKPTK